MEERGGGGGGGKTVAATCPLVGVGLKDKSSTP